MKKEKILNICMIFSIIFFVLCGAIIVGSVKGWGDAKEPTGMIVSEKKGIVMLERNHVSYEVSPGTAVRAGDQFLTTDGATLVITDENQRDIFIDSNSKIVIKESNEKLVYEVLQGNVVGDTSISKQSDDGKPGVYEGENAANTKPGGDEGQTMTCTIEIVCDVILENMEDLLPEKEGYVPSDGIVLHETTVTFNEGETVFDVLQRVCRDADIPLEYSYAPIYESYYIEGINHLYEFDCGSQSGWMYQVNGTFPNYGCSSYGLNEGDTIVWCYTCDGLGADVGI